MRERWSWRGAVAGLIAAAALVWAMVGGVLPGGLPLAAAIMERARGLLPVTLQALIIARLKFAAKPLGFWMSLAAVVLVAAVLGGLWGRRPRRGWTSALAAFAVTSAGLVAVAWAPAFTYLSALAGAEGAADPAAAATRVLLSAVAGYAALAAAVFAAALGLLNRTARRAGPTSLPVPAASGGPTGRRQFLARSLAAGAALSGLAGALRWAGRTAAAAQAGAQSLFQQIRGLPPEVTPTDTFYVVSKNPAGLDPRVDARRWKLEITGLVGKPITLTYDEIRAMPAVSRYHTLECISNEVGGDLIGNAHWKGVRFRDLIARAGGVSPTAIRFALRCADGYTEGLPVADAMQPDVLLVYEMNGAPLTPAHGFPVRMLVPGLFGMKNPKWLTKIEAVSTHFTGYWQASGWSDEAVVKTTSMFRVPPDRGRLPRGEVGLGGVAYSGDRGIKDVQVSTDGGKTWRQAQVKPPLGPYTWVLWAAVWTPSGPGEYTLKVRARDGQGVMQTAQEAPTLPDGATGYHTIRVRVA